MVNPINDNVLGNRFWLVNDLGKQDQVQNPPPADPNADPEKINPKSTIFTFAANGDDAMTTSAINKAELFAASHTLSEEQEQQEAARANDNLSALIGNNLAVNNLVDELAAGYIQHFDRTSLEDAKRVCRTALRKLIVTREFDERARLPLSTGNPADRLLGQDGLAALKNAVLGLSHMLKEGQISEKAVLVLADGDFYDASNRTDLLRLTAESAKKVKQLFIGEARYNNLIKQCEDALDDANHLSDLQKNRIRLLINGLRSRARDAIALRTAAASGIKTDYQLAASANKASDARSFQKKQLGQIRNSLRAFRYDLDMLCGTKFTAMEWVRRKADNLFSSSTAHRITRAEFNAMQEADRVFNSQLNQIQNDIMGGARGNAQANVQGNPQGNAQANADVYANASADVNWASRVNLADAAKAATRLAHLTNDRIRYHYSGAEKRAAEHFAEINKELGSIAEDGGSREVIFRAGADALFEFGFFGVDFNAKAGLSAEVTAKIQVDNADGTVKVTYSIGGVAEASAATQLGADPTNTNGRLGLGAKVTGQLSGALTHSVTKTYANLEEFAHTASRLNMVMTPRPCEVFYAWTKSAIKGIGHLFTMGATALGFRIHRSTMDQVAYSAELRNRNVFGELGGVLLKKRNVELLGESKLLTVKGGGQLEADGGIYFPHEEEVGSNLEFNAQIGAEYTRELSAKGKIYSSFVRSLGTCSANFLDTQFTTEKAAVDDQWANDLKALVDEVKANHTNAQTVAQGLSKLGTRLAELEESAIGIEAKDTTFWNGFAAKARLLAIATALLSKYAEALPPAQEGAEEAKRTAKAAGEYIVPRLANPVVKVPSKVFRERFFNVFDLAKPRTSKTIVFANVKVDPFGTKLDDKLDEWGIGDDAKDTLKGGTLNTAAKAGADFAKETANLSGKIQIRYTEENKVSKHNDARPWLNTTGRKTFELNLPVSLPIRAAVDTIARYYCKKIAGLDEVESQKFVQEFWDGFTDAFKRTLESVIIDGAVPFLDMTLAEAAEKSPVLKAMLGGVSFLKDKYDADYTFDDDTYKQLRFEIDGDGRFAGFALVDGYDTTAKLELTPKNFFSINFSLTSSTLVNDFMAMPRPKVYDLLQRADDYTLAGNPEGFKNFLARNKKGVVRLLKAGKENAADEAHDDDKYWRPDCTDMTQTITQCKNLLNSLAAKNTLIGYEAKDFQATFNDLAEEVQQQGNLTDEQVLDLAARFFTAAAKVYTLAAMDASLNAA